MGFSKLLRLAAVSATLITQGTLTAQTPGLSHSVAWNNAAVTFIAQTLDVTDTASAAGSLLARWRVGGVDKFVVSKAGAVTAGAASFTTLAASGNVTIGASTFVVTAATGAVSTSGSLAITGALTGVTTLNMSGALTLNSGTAAAQVITLGESTAGTSPWLKMLTGSAKYAWLIAAQQNVDNGLEFTPSTAVGGTTFSTPMMVLKATGVTIASLAGVGTRAVVVDANGVLSAP